MDPVSPPSRNGGPRVNRETILSLSDGGSVKKDGYAIAGEQRRRSPGRKEIGVEMLGLFPSSQSIIRRRLADRHRIGPRKSFLEGFVELPIELALLLRDRRSGRRPYGFAVVLLMVFHWGAPCLRQRLARLYVRARFVLV
jgi:hypothetical protein